MVRRSACWAPGVMLKNIVSSSRAMDEGIVSSPVGFIQNDDLVPPWRKSDFLLCKCFDFVADHVDTSLTVVQYRVKAEY